MKHEGWVDSWIHHYACCWSLTNQWLTIDQASPIWELLLTDRLMDIDHCGQLTSPDVLVCEGTGTRETRFSCVDITVTVMLRNTQQTSGDLVIFGFHIVDFAWWCPYRTQQWWSPWAQKSRMGEHGAAEVQNCGQKQPDHEPLWLKGTGFTDSLMRAQTQAFEHLELQQPLSWGLRAWPTKQSAVINSLDMNLDMTSGS